MADRGFNGTTAVFGSTMLKVIGVTDNQGGAVIDTSEGDDTAKEYVNGTDDPELTLTVKGGTSIAKGDHDTLTITWNDGTTSGDGAAFLVSGKRTTGSIDNPITTELTFKPYGGA